MWLEVLHLDYLALLSNRANYPATMLSIPAIVPCGYNYAASSLGDLLLPGTLNVPYRLGLQSLYIVGHKFN